MKPKLVRDPARDQKESFAQVVTGVVPTTEFSMTKLDKSRVVVVIRALILVYVNMSEYLLLGFDVVYI